MAVCFDQIHFDWELIKEEPNSLMMMTDSLVGLDLSEAKVGASCLCFPDHSHLKMGS